MHAIASQLHQPHQPRDLGPGEWLSHRGTRYQVRAVEAYREHQVEKGFVAVSGFIMAALVVFASIAVTVAADRPWDRNNLLPKGAIIDGMGMDGLASGRIGSGQFVQFPTATTSASRRSAFRNSSNPTRSI